MVLQPDFGSLKLTNNQEDRRRLAQMSSVTISLYADREPFGEFVLFAAPGICSEQNESLGHETRLHT